MIDRSAQNHLGLSVLEIGIHLTFVVSIAALDPMQFREVVSKDGRIIAWVTDPSPMLSLSVEQVLAEVATGDVRSG